MVSKGFLNVTTSGQQYNIGEKPSPLYCALTLLSMQGHQNHNLFHLRVPDYSSSSNNMAIYGLREAEVKAKFN